MMIMMIKFGRRLYKRFTIEKYEMGYHNCEEEYKKIGKKMVKIW